MRKVYSFTSLNCARVIRSVRAAFRICTNGYTVFRTEQHRLSRCDLARGWWPKVAGRTRTIPGAGSKRPRVAAAGDSLHARQWLLTSLRQSQISAIDSQLTRCERAAHWRSERATAGAADPSSIYRATDERRELVLSVKLSKSVELTVVAVTIYFSYCYFILLYIDSLFAAVDGVHSSDYS
ncbi:hypothetical protein T09_5264 [Trichinella sp. T9]|nr:hypothetical protein T09_5264 [Trichinella sp. T9]